MKNWWGRADLNRRPTPFLLPKEVLDIRKGVFMSKAAQACECHNRARPLPQLYYTF